MKNLLILPFVFLLPKVTSGQNGAKNPNVVYFHAAELSDKELFVKVVTLMKEEGYKFDEFDKDFFKCSTQARKDKDWTRDMRYKILVDIEDSLVSLRLLYYDRFEYAEWQQAAARGPRMSIPRYGWAKLTEFAGSLEDEIGGELTYISESPDTKPGFFRAYIDNLKQNL